MSTVKFEPTVKWVDQQRNGSNYQHMNFTVKFHTFGIAKMFFQRGDKRIRTLKSPAKQTHIARLRNPPLGSFFIHKCKDKSSDELRSP